MNIVDAIRARKAEPTQPVGRLRATPSDERYRIPPAHKIEQQTALYANLAWIQIAVGISAQTCAATPYKIKRQAETIEQHPLIELLNKPNPNQPGYAFMEETFAWRNTTGMAYWWLNTPDANTPPSELWIVPSNRIEAIPDGQMGIAGWSYDPGDGQRITLEPWEIIQFKTWSPLSRYAGLSAIQAINTDAQTDINSQKFSANFYGRDNAKMGGILAFADNIDQPRWDRMDADIREQHGGTKNKNFLKLRNVGPGGVQWITTQFSQSEMQYLEQRRFTKEEIYDLFAPGLGSMLAINATEANSTAGKDTFLSMAIYPQHIAIASHINLKLLPLYGDTVEMFAFDDVRRVDTIIELKEQEAYERNHFIDETRQKYYGDSPLPNGQGQRRSIDAMPAAPAIEPAITQDAIVAAGKLLDKRRWRDKAAKALVAGRDIAVSFDPEYLTDDEAMQIRADLKLARTADDIAALFGR